MLSIATDFKKAGVNKFSLKFPSAKEANKFVEIFWTVRDVVFLRQFWFASIPNYKIFKRVILAGIDDLEIRMETLKDNMRPPAYWHEYWEPPTSVERLKRRVVNVKNDNAVSYVNTRAVIATFKNFLLTSFVHILGKRIYLNPFVQRITKCDHCLRYGHSANICKNQSKPCICAKCGVKAVACASPLLSCINCLRDKSNSKTDHAADHEACPIFRQQKELRRIMAVYCFLIGEALNFLKTGRKVDRYSQHREGSGRPVSFDGTLDGVLPWDGPSFSEVVRGDRRGLRSGAGAGSVGAMSSSCSLLGEWLPSSLLRGTGPVDGGSKCGSPISKVFKAGSMVDSVSSSAGSSRRGEFHIKRGGVRAGAGPGKGLSFSFDGLPGRALSPSTFSSRPAVAPLLKKIKDLYYNFIEYYNLEKAVGHDFSYRSDKFNNSSGNSNVNDSIPDLSMFEKIKRWAGYPASIRYPAYPATL